MRPALLASLCLASLTGCPGTPCDFPIRCVDSCDTRNEVSFMCGPCPAGSVPISTCTDGGPPADAPRDAVVPPDGLVDDAPPTTDAPAGDAPAMLSNDVVSPDCGPADGPALRFGFFQTRIAGTCDGDPAQRSVSLYVHDLGGVSFPPVAPVTITSTGGDSGNASECPGGSPPCRSSGDFTLTLDTYTEGTGATGSYSIRWPGGGTTTGTFDAAWCGTRPLCG